MMMGEKMGSRVPEDESTGVLPDTGGEYPGLDDEDYDTDDDAGIDDDDPELDTEV